MLPFTHSRRSSSVLAFFIIAILFLLWNHEEAAAHLPATISEFTPTVWSDYLSAGDVAPLVGTANATLGVSSQPGIISQPPPSLLALNSKHQK